MDDKYSYFAVNSKQKISPELAAEIIRRTDSFYGEFYCGNNHKFNRSLYKLSGVPADWEELEKDHSCCDMSIRDIIGKDFSEKFDNVEKWRKSWGCLELSWVWNQWISSCYIGGPHGWISPNGEVGGLMSIGKYPNTDEITEDLIKIAKEWPILEFTAYEVDQDDIEYVYARWEVKDGKAELVKRDYKDPKVQYSGIQADPETYRKHFEDGIHDYECWWTLDELKELWKDRI